MGNQACCAQKDSELDKLATTAADELRSAEAVPVGNDGAIAGAPAADDVGTIPVLEQGSYSVSLDKASGQKLGLDVDYMAERLVLPIMAITGGLAEEWNKGHPESQLKKGDSIIEVNGTRLNVAVMLEKCKSEAVLNLALRRAMTYDNLVADLENLVKVKGCGPILIRTSWHEAGFASSAGLPAVALKLLSSITQKYCPDLIAHPDLWALAANVAIRLMGGPDIPTRFGRPEAKPSSEGGAAEGRVPEVDKGAEHLRAAFGPKGFDDRAIVALLGASFEGPKWTDSLLKFDNSYYKELASKTGSALLQDASFKKHVEEFANDQSVWFSDFTKSWIKIQESGRESSLRDVL